jgi:hypothetical protein
VGDMDLIGVVALTCLAAYLWGTRRAGLSGAGLRAATTATLETIGLCVLFLAANLAVALLAILVARPWIDRFLSVYALDYVTFAGVSLLQGLLCRWWRERG